MIIATIENGGILSRTYRLSVVHLVPIPVFVFWFRFIHAVVCVCVCVQSSIGDRFVSYCDYPGNIDETVVTVPNRCTQYRSHSWTYFSVEDDAVE